PGVMASPEEAGRGFRVGPDPAQVVPVVPAAALFDLGRGGDWRARPDAGLGREAAEAAARTDAGAPVAQGNVGAGTGAVVGGIKGGVGTASVVLPSGTTVAALAVVNAAGSVVEPRTGALYGQLCEGLVEIPEPGRHRDAQEVLAAARQESAKRQASSVRPLNTTLAVVATDAALSRAQAHKLAGTAHDGLARAVRPVHLLNDGDTVFALATGDRPLPEGDLFGNPALPVAGALNEILAAGADVLTRSVVKAVLAAKGVDGQGGVFPSYSDLYGD
ncbi:P1 family peptidase, partial [Streptomyces sp. UNOC14_S4]|uniref:P1 family peptidase n=1 Tax=Streptomyces sp. UNOC14_S4 TaxID=2872340 RepID=UPI001E2FA675